MTGQNVTQIKERRIFMATSNCDIGGTCKELEVLSAMNSLRFSIEKLSDTAKTIRDRINSVMRNEPASTVPDCKKVVTAYSTPLAEEINVQTLKIDAEIATLKSCIDRLEI
jgi:hypothetical protein